MDMSSVEFLKEWLSNVEWWFAKDPKIDAYLTERYAHLLDQHLCGLVGVIVYDQLPRHVYRRECAHHIVAYYLQKALRARESVLAPDDIREYIMYQLPVRHTNDAAAIHGVMADAWVRAEAWRGRSDFPLFKRFLRATYDRCPKSAMPFLARYEGGNAPTHTANAFPPSELSRCVADFTSRLNPSGIIVSLSGGVDSMVLLNILLQYVPRRNIIAVHINYCNRSTVREEEEFVIDYCYRQGIVLFIRRINEILREPCMKLEMRDTYETYTREQRFAAYRDVARLVGVAEGSPPCVFMGHNQDDTIENILTNVAQKKKYNNLLGMSTEEVVSGIRFCRPLLEIAKTDIYKYAAQNGVPHLPDSTLAWSQRGKIRASVVPTMLEWEPRSLTGLQALAHHLIDLSAVLEQLVRSCVDRIVDGHTITFAGAPPSSPLFWRMFFAQSSGNVVSMRALQAFCDRLKRGKCGKMPMKKGFVVHITTTREGSEWELAWNQEIA